MQRGFALPETLVAAAIGAAVVAGAAQSISIALRTAAKTVDLEARMIEAETILARIEADLDVDDALTGMTGWVITEAPYQSEPATDVSLSLWTLSHRESSQMTFQTVRLER